MNSIFDNSHLIAEFNESYAAEGASERTFALFRSVISAFYQENKRRMPWRNIKNRYRVFVSEVMLQQTQVSRVRVKYPEFIERFPDFESLASAPLASVLSAWQGLGYNRRALLLRQAAEIIARDYGGRLPADRAELEKLPGIGRATAASIYVFAFNKPCAFIETNIRTVYIHFFFPKTEKVPDSDILPLVEQSMDRENPREWFYALMDYGVYLKKLLPGRNTKSAHYTKQSPFKDSDRQIRGIIIRILLDKFRLSEKEIVVLTGKEKERIRNILEGMERDGLIVKKSGVYQLA